MISFRNAKFIKSAPRIGDAPDEKLPNILIVGKSNVGKSSLINALCEQKSLAYTSSKPGHTTLLNYYLIDSQFYLVDAPGYGYSSRDKMHFEKFGVMMEEFFAQNDDLKGVIFLIDSRHDLSSDDLDFHSFIKRSDIPFIVVFTKADKLNQKDMFNAKKRIKESLGDEPVFFTSIKEKSSLSLLKAEIANILK